MHCGKVDVHFHSVDTKLNHSLEISESTTSTSVKDQEGEGAKDPYLDKHHLLKGAPGDAPIQSIHREWFINQAAICAHMKNADEATRKQLELLMLHGYSKVSTGHEKDYKEFGTQTTPLLFDEGCYHRVTRNFLLSRLYEIYSSFLELEAHEIFLIDSPLVKEVFARELPQPGLNLEIDHQQAFRDLIGTLLDHAKSGQFPTQRILIDLSPYLNKHSMAPKEIKKVIVNQLEDLFMEKLNEFMTSNPTIKLEDISDRLISKLHLVAFIQYRGQHLLFLPEFLLNLRFDKQGCVALNRSSIMNRHGAVYRELDSMISRCGFRLDPAQAKEAWLKLQDAKTILQSFNLPMAQFAKQGTIPTIWSSFHDFMQMPVVNKFRNLSQGQQLAPYLQIMPEATWRLLDGLDQYKKNGGISQEFKNRNLEQFLQISFFRMQNAMNEAIFKKNNIIAFNNQIELIHQEIQNILAIVQPYGEKELADAIVQKLTQGNSAVIPSDLGSPKVHLKASAMRGLSSILAGIEAEKGSNRLNVAVLKDSYYYASNDNLKLARTHQLFVLDSHHFNQSGIDQAFDTFPSEPIDLFICEFHHNISAERQSYKPEKILKQVQGLVAKEGLVADKFTVAIDTTIDLEKSKEMRAFFADETIKTLIQDGKLNVILLRSAQKFDMLGFDNYYGGLTISINQAFKRFNARMALPEDQLKGLNYQGLAHLHKYGRSSADAFRKGVMENTQKLYKMLPPKAIYQPQTSNPLQISQIHDRKIFFLDIKFPQYPKSAQAFLKCLKKFARKEKLFFTTRPSFSFLNTNLTIIEGKRIRLALGLENEQTLKRYAAFFHSLQSVIDQTILSKRETATKSDDLLAASILNMPIH